MHERLGGRRASPRAAGLSDEVIDELLAGASTDEEIVGAAGCSPS